MLNTLHRNIELPTWAAVLLLVVFITFLLENSQLLGFCINLPEGTSVVIIPYPRVSGFAFFAIFVLTIWAFLRLYRLAIRSENSVLYCALPLALLPISFAPFFFRAFLPIFIVGNLPILTASILISSSLLLINSRYVADVNRYHVTRLFLMFSFVVLVGGFTALGTYFTDSVGPHSGDEGHYIVQAESLYADHDLDIRNNVDNPEDSERRRLHISPNSRGEHWYSNHPFGLSVLLAPVINHGIVLRHFVLAIASAMGIIGIIKLCQIYNAKFMGIVFTTGLLAFSSIWGIYSSRTLPEITGATLLTWFMYAVFVQKRRPWGSFFLAVFCFFCLPWLQVRFLPSGLLAAGFYGLWGLFGERFTKKNLFRMLLFALFCIISLAIYFYVYNQLFVTGRSYSSSGWRLFRYPLGIWQQLGSRRGILYSLPVFAWLVMANVKVLLRDKDHRFKTLTVFVHLVAVLVTSCTLWVTEGSCLPGRYLVILLPLLIPAAACAFDQSDKVTQWWFFFLGMLSIVPFFMMLLKLVDFQKAFALYHDSIPIVFPQLYGYSPALLDPYQYSLHPFAIGIYIATGLMLFLPLQMTNFRVGVAISTIALGLFIHQIYPADAHLLFKKQLISNPAQTARLLSRMDLNNAHIVLKTGSENQSLLSVINRFHHMPERKKRRISTDDADLFSKRTFTSQSDQKQNILEHRGYRWDRLVPSFYGGIGKREFQLTGSFEGDATPVLAILEDDQIIVEKTLSHRNGRVDISCLVETKYNNPINILFRLENGEGVFQTESIGWAPYSKKLLQSAKLHLPAQFGSVCQ